MVQKNQLEPEGETMVELVTQGCDGPGNPGKFLEAHGKNKEVLGDSIKAFFCLERITVPLSIQSTNLSTLFSL